ncbi:undecaprenyl-diphosphate phosphatase [Vallitalea guaymasensis]|uniref:Undecaprenyl-diphosphatase n=1 Tax=Vallitalea guaymasensis TaxID=1185412 RepID=A0A8J8MF84_9FIRM|nr:undecaprenyl-diphosphate phosphatase [Vallitalea guaymasensis]QUH31836.1 undecaprenyl-diphosphate phosphatase [Vallitalea guaymasensis]
MSFFEAILMGIVQGVTEFLPISSSGHLAISRHILGLQLDNILFEVLLHIGTLVAIIAVYYKDVIDLIVSGLGLIGRLFKYIIISIGNLIYKNNKKVPQIIDNDKKKFVMLIIVASIPTAIIGLILEEKIIESFDILLVPGICLIITGFLLYSTIKLKSGTKKEGKTSYKDAIIIGTFQGFAGLPGISRSGSTIVASLLRGLNKEFAVKFSFLMSLPAVIGAMILQIKDLEWDTLSTIITAPYVVGMAVSAFVGYICIKFLIKLIKQNKLHYFAYYCFVIGIIIIISHFVL